jgi:hypothetical protein
MRTEFNNLVETLKTWDLYQIGDEVDIAISELDSKITEIENRIECARRSNLESNDIVLKMTETFEGEGAIEDKITYGDFEVLSRGVYDVDIALNFNDKEPIENNWYGLFKENVSRETKVLIPKGSIVEWRETIKYFSAIGGAKAIVLEDYTTEHESNDKTIQVEWIDEKANGQSNGGYYLEKFKDNFEQSKPPTFLCHSDDIHNVVKDVIQKLKDIEVDGETMQYILQQVGMEEQILTQLLNEVSTK